MWLEWLVIAVTIVSEIWKNCWYKDVSLPALLCLLRYKTNEIKQSKRKEQCWFRFAGNNVLNCLLEHITLFYHHSHTIFGNNTAIWCSTHGTDTLWLLCVGNKLSQASLNTWKGVYRLSDTQVELKQVDVKAESWLCFINNTSYCLKCYGDIWLMNAEIPT